MKLNNLTPCLLLLKDQINVKKNRYKRDKYKKEWKINHLHLLDKLTVLGLDKAHMPVEGAADPGVRDHWGEDLRAVHLEEGSD